MSFDGVFQKSYTLLSKNSHRFPPCFQIQYPITGLEQQSAHLTIPKRSDRYPYANSKNGTPLYPYHFNCITIRIIRR